MIDYTALKSEIQTDPTGLGYAGKDLVTVAALLNQLGPTINLTAMSKSDFLLALIPAVAALASASSTVQAKWDRFLAMVEASDTVAVGSAPIQSLIGQTVTDALLSQAQATALTQRQGSRAELLFGQDTVVQWQDVSEALNGNS